MNCTNLSTSDFEVIKLLGRGTFGIVRQVRCRRDNQVYAIKSIPLQKKKFTYKVNQHGNLQEVEIMSDMEHPNIIRMIASFTGMDFGHKQAFIAIENPPTAKLNTIESGQYSSLPPKQLQQNSSKHQQQRPAGRLITNKSTSYDRHHHSSKQHQHRWNDNSSQSSDGDDVEDVNRSELLAAEQQVELASPASPANKAGLKIALDSNLTGSGKKMSHHSRGFHHQSSAMSQDYGE